MTTSMGIMPPTVSTGLMVNPLERVTPTHDVAHLSQREQVSLPKESLQHRVVSPSSEIIGERCSYIYWYDEDYIECLRPTDSYDTWYTTIKRFVT